MTEKENTTVPQKKRIGFQTIVSIIIIFLLIVHYIWNWVETNKLKKQHITEISDIKTKANNAIAENNKKNIETLTRVFAWAVRSEMLRSNMEQVSTYMNELVKSADLTDISAIKSDGIVVLSTNKKFEGNAYPGSVANELGSINDVTLRTDADGNIICIAPIMGLDSRLGSIIINYSPKTTLLDNAE
jgi:hypothetical protein